MNDFQKEYRFFKPQLDKTIDRCLKSGWYILGREVSEFEQNFAKYTNTKHAIGVANGLEALQIALMALGIGEGDEVITVSNSAVATALAISNVGAKPVFVDVDEYYHMDYKLVEKAITKKTKAIIPVHLFGQIVDIEKIVRIAKKNNLKIIEDACQAHGASFRSKKAGSFGDVNCFSFYPTKNLGAYGDGGVITTNSKEIYEKCLRLRNYGQSNRYEHTEKGLNSRLDELQAAILNLKLKKLDLLTKKRQQIAEVYFKHLRDIKEIKVPKQRKNSNHVFHLFVIEAESRVSLQEYLKDNGISSLIHYPIPIHKQKAYSEFNSIILDRTEMLAKTILSLPIHPFMTNQEAKKVCMVIKSFYQWRNRQKRKISIHPAGNFSEGIKI